MVVFRDDWRQKTYCKRALGLCTVLYIDRTFALAYCTCVCPHHGASESLAPNNAPTRNIVHVPNFA